MGHVLEVANYPVKDRPRVAPALSREKNRISPEDNSPAISMGMTIRASRRMVSNPANGAVNKADARVWAWARGAGSVERLAGGQRGGQQGGQQPGDQQNDQQVAGGQQPGDQQNPDAQDNQNGGQGQNGQPGQRGQGGQRGGQGGQRGGQRGGQLAGNNPGGGNFPQNGNIQPGNQLALNGAATQPGDLEPATQPADLAAVTTQPDVNPTTQPDDPNRLTAQVPNGPDGPPRCTRCRRGSPSPAAVIANGPMACGAWRKWSTIRHCVNRPHRFASAPRPCATITAGAPCRQTGIRFATRSTAHSWNCAIRSRKNFFAGRRRRRSFRWIASRFPPDYAEQVKPLL